MKADEMKRAKAHNGTQPQEFTVALDALAVYVHKDNPLDSISIEELCRHLR
jgi:phosphate transport system substrate-binding protein